MNRNELKQELTQTYKIPDGPGACQYLYRKAICEIDNKFCIFVIIDHYLELGLLEEEPHQECLTEPIIPDNPLLVWRRLNKRRLVPTSFVPPEYEGDY